MQHLDEGAEPPGASVGPQVSGHDCRAVSVGIRAGGPSALLRPTGRVTPILIRSRACWGNVMHFNMLRLDQSRQVADLGQVFGVMREGRDRLAHYRGTMRWKTIKGRAYLYRRVGIKDVSLGPRSPETEAIKLAFDQGKATAQSLHDDARRRIEVMAPVNRALGLGRVPVIAARIARRLLEERLLGTSVSIVGTNALFCYEAMAGGHFSNDLAATEDIDLLFDCRMRMQIVSEELSAAGLIGILKSVDRSFERLSGGFRVVNRDNYLVDLIAPMSKNAVRSPPQSLTDAEGDLVAAEIPGLQWLVSAPKVTAMAIDMRGLPVQLHCVDPRAFAVHKLWLSDRGDRDPPKRMRDRAQAMAVAQVVRRHLPNLRFDDRSLETLPKALRNRLSEFSPEDPGPDADW